MRKIPIDLQTSNPREAALVVLVHFRDPGTNATLLLRNLRERGEIRGPDARLAEELAMGVIRHRSRLDGLLRTMTHGSWAKTPGLLRDLLRLGAYQVLSMDRIPAYAAVNETVHLAKRWASPQAAAMVNAVLRRLARRKPAEIPDKPPPQNGWPQFYSHPAWLVRYFLSEYTPEQVSALLEWNNRTPALMLRANRLRTSAAELAEHLAADGCEIGRVGRPAPETVEVLGGIGDPGATVWLAEGWATVQDGAAQLIGHLVAPRAGERIVDWCAAPGGKTTHLAELAADRAGILALDVDPGRLAHVTDHAQRLGLSSIRTYNLRPELVEWLTHNPADAVLVDAPCTGLGTIQRHPDIRWRRRAMDLERSPRLQGEILDAAARCVAPGGRLVYCTCSLGRTENERVVELFLERHKRFRRADPSTGVDPFVAPFLNEVGDLHTWPPEHRIDGFYAAVLVFS